MTYQALSPRKRAVKRIWNMSFVQRHYLQFLQLFIPLLLLVCGVFYALYLAELNNLKDRISSQHQTSITQAAALIRLDLEGTEKDVAYLANQPSVKHWLEQQTDAARDNLTEDFKNFMQRYPNYDQVRYLDQEGN